MATKKRVQTAAQKRNAKIASKTIKAPKPVKTTKKKRKVVPKARRLLDSVVNVHTELAGGVVLLSLTTSPEVTELEVAVNGRGVWKGLP